MTSTNSSDNQPPATTSPLTGTTAETRLLTTFQTQKNAVTEAATTAAPAVDSAVVAVVVAVIVLTLVVAAFLLYRYLCHNKGAYRTTGELAPGADPDEDGAGRDASGKKEYFI